MTNKQAKKDFFAALSFTVAALLILPVFVILFGKYIAVLVGVLG